MFRCNVSYTGLRCDVLKPQTPSLSTSSVPTLMPHGVSTGSGNGALISSGTSSMPTLMPLGVSAGSGNGALISGCLYLC